jgi:uncharacterized protein (TIGR02118 family)
MSLFRRKQGMSVDEFQAYWRTRHAEIVCRMPGIRRYVQSHTLLSGYGKRTPVCDGVGELWFDDADALRRLGDCTELRDVQADHVQFIDLSSYIEIVTEDVVIKGGEIPAGAVKNIELVKKKASMNPEAFHRYWIEVHGPLGGSIPQVRRYVQSHTRIGAYSRGREPVLDGAALTWFDATDSMRAAATTTQYVNTRADEVNFLTVPLDFVITTENVVVA